MAQRRDIIVRPRRRIEKKISWIDLNVGLGPTNYTLHTCEDSKTLVRAIVKLTFSCEGAGASRSLNAILTVAPSGTRIFDPNLAQTLDININKTYLAGKYIAHDIPAGLHEMVTWDFDSKGMRKLEEGDLIMLSTAASHVNMFHASGTVTLFFKE